MKILVACEESQVVTNAFRKRGHEAFSCDILETSGNNPQWHYKMNIFDLLKKDSNWDMLLAFPPCTYLTITGNRWFLPEYQDRYPDRPAKREEAIEFFLNLYNLPIDKIAIENPVGVISSVFRKPDQIIQPYQFGDPFEKRTCLWLKNLPKLVSTNIVSPPKRSEFSGGKSMATWYSNAPKKLRHILRAKTFPGIANAMADQWG